MAFITTPAWGSFLAALSHSPHAPLCPPDRRAIMVWVKSMGRQILAGNLNLVNTSFPVLMFEPRSYLQKLADMWVHPGAIAWHAARHPSPAQMESSC